ncbi:MAG: TonB-dependent receptor [Candidatus Pelagadaptatus aseana]|uniref:TonB-dependent receptor family protein n=1 Tax=Candidatus Pelagadaptatus aseana TaxID=3120508 RepID=UPI0039B33257
MFKQRTLAAAIALATSAFALADNHIEEVTIIGSPEDARQVAGSGAVVGSEQINIESLVDINQALKTVPGIYIREEDGAGLRPNIGIRGATSERSSKVTLMEDGVMIAPAPYTAPDAYYFPTAMRMSNIEVLKGAPLLRYGPQTTGGVINMVTTPIPAENGGEVELIVDERGSTDIHAHYGANSGQWSWLVETVQRDAEGFKDIDRSSQDTGFDIEDYMVKVGWQSAGEGPKQNLLLKLQYSEETSDETYLGLTDADFKADEDRRYGLSELDQMNNRHEHLSLTHNIELSDTVSMQTIAYFNEYKRDWFKLSGGGSYVDAANAGDANAQGILDGTIDEAGLDYKHNNRVYKSRGLDVNFDIDLGNHQVAVGGRLHDDEMDRYQPVEVYDQVNGELVYVSTTAPTGSNNREEETEAYTLWLTDSWQATETLNVNMALRYERVDSSRVQWDNPERTVVDSTRSSKTEELLPGVSFTYDLNNQWQLLAGVHKGFSPLGGGAKETEDPETSINYEAGARFSQDAWFVEAIAFYSDFSDKAENCSVGSPCSNGDTSGSFTTGEAVIQGVELQASTSFMAGDFTVPVDLAYTYTDAEATQNSADNTTVLDGDTLKDVPEHTASLRVGLEHGNGWNNYAVAKYISETCVEAGCNRTNDPFGETDSLFVVDFISRYTLNSDATVFLKVENLLDQQEIVSRTPDGARPNKARTASVGINYKF